MSKRKASGGTVRSPDRPSPIRMREIADHVGVTPMTVSRALRTPEKLSDATLRKIRKAIKEFGFIDPSYLVQTLGGQVTRW